ncbi:hypothetical protein ACHAXR_006394 [Thalassiosira sp. AJA248-18]
MGGVLGKQTWSRYLVMNYFSKYKWYNPNVDNRRLTQYIYSQPNTHIISPHYSPDAPSLAKGWAYFEHFTLPRRFDSKSGGHHIRAPPGEAKSTKLYSAFGTPMESLSDWGIGMGMYFSSLSALTVIFFLAGCLNVANTIYYASENYDPSDDKSSSAFALLNMLQFSAICMDREWVVCADCKDHKERWNSIFTEEYYATGSAFDDNGNEITLISRTKCEPAEFAQGMINYGTLLLLIVCMGLFMWYLSKKEVRFDEDNTSAPDYTVVVHNPPGDAVDPDEWRDFFDQFSNKGVTLCTVALNNEELLKKLVQRRKDIKLLRRAFPMGIECDFDDEASVDFAVNAARDCRIQEKNERGCLSKLLGSIFTPLLNSLGFALPEEAIWERIKKTADEIKTLQEKEYQAAAIYITFETEDGQRTALDALNAGEMEVMMNRPVNLDSSALFHGKVLRATEASEPNAVRWADLHYTRQMIYLRLLITFSITLGLVFFSAFVLQLSRLRVNTILFSIILTTFNSIIPIIVRMLVSYEKHYDEGSLQASLYVKITFFRWVNTAIITRLITPFLVTLGNKSWDLINTVNALMISEMVFAPLLRYLDFAQIISRHYFAPRAKTEEELFSCFRGGYYNLAERFTDFTKVLLLCTFYSAFYPLIYFLGAAILFFQYWMDKFLLLRSWQKAPNTGQEISSFSRIYFNTAAILLGAISSGYAYARSPFTFLCSCADNPSKECGTMPDTLNFNIEKLSGATENDVTASSEAFYFCNQFDISFPPVPSVQGSDKWMTDSQERLTKVYGWTCLVLLILYCVVVLGGRIIRKSLSMFRGVYEPRGWNQHKDFSSGVGLESFGYIPQLDVIGFHFPLLACNVDGIDVRLIGWKDPNAPNEMDPHRKYDNHNLIFDVPHDSLHRSRNVAVDGSSMSCVGEGKIRPIFSLVKHYPPKWAQRAKDNNQS